MSRAQGAESAVVMRALSRAVDNQGRIVVRDACAWGCDAYAASRHSSARCAVPSKQRHTCEPDFGWQGQQSIMGDVWDRVPWPPFPRRSSAAGSSLLSPRSSTTVGPWSTTP